jgi:hypothetical protein
MVTSVNGTPYDDLINSIIFNNSNTINFDTSSCSFNLQTCNNQSVDSKCKIQSVNL